MEIKVPWKEPKDEKLREYLQSTIYCDKEDEEMLEVLAELIKDVKTPMEAVVEIFDFLKKKIKFTLDPPKPSKEVLKSGFGNCFNKASLQIAMLRAASIPARYRMDS
ncbi:MAG: transglutaminase-like domain-containing protein, partial [Candidatus Methanospirareceae archaeon]